MLRTLFVTTAFATTLACDWVNEPYKDGTTDTDLPEDDCSTGQYPPTSANVVVTNFAWAGLPQLVEYTDDVELAGGTPACIGLQGISGTWRLVAGGRFLGKLSVTAPRTGNFNDPNEDVTVTLDLSGASPPGLITTGLWSSGSTRVLDDGSTFTIVGNTFMGSDDDGVIVAITFNATATR